MSAFRPFDQPIVDSSAFTYPVGYQISGHGRCKSCGASIAWLVSDRTGKTSPWNPDATSHFASCPQSQAWRDGKLSKKRGAHV